MPHKDPEARKAYIREYNKRYRAEHLEYFKEKLARYRGKVKPGRSAGARWSPDEINRILSIDRPSDEELAVELGRTITAIQVKRSKLTRGYE